MYYFYCLCVDRQNKKEKETRGRGRHVGTDTFPAGCRESVGPFLAGGRPARHQAAPARPSTNTHYQQNEEDDDDDDDGI